MKWFILGLIFGTAVSVSAQQLIPGMPPDSRDMQMQQFFNQQQFNQMRQDQQHDWNDWGWRGKPC